ncbi:hypothetical protein [Hymenobacter rubidus]|uniref:hypothetical protein n=1 Tax=Hymenobacter rubidus TaxID=1441626 RepID=UPI00191E0300|nr:hypothetical protein [Hymenobacter rubidus]
MQNPLFDEEKEFLERKKLEYERALRGDVEHIKEQSATVGKIALVGVGLAGGIWLITKAFGGKGKKHKGRSKRRHNPENDEADYDNGFGSSFAAHDDERGVGALVKSAADSAAAFVEHHEHTHESDDLGFGSKATYASDEPAMASYHEPAHRSFAPDEFEEDPFQDLPYDDSRRLPASHAFDGDETPVVSAANSRSRMIGAVLQSFLQSDTGKVLVGQVAAVALALVTKKVGEFFPADKNADLATPTGQAAAAAGYSPAASSATSVSSDASTQPQSL